MPFSDIDNMEFDFDENETGKIENISDNKSVNEIENLNP